MQPEPPDVIVLGAQWPERALLRAQLIEEGHEVIAVDTWPIPRIHRRPGMKPRVLLIDLHKLPKPRETLDEVRFVLPPERVLVVTALGTLTGEEVRGRGFNVIECPATIGQIVAAIGALLSRPLAAEGANVPPASRTDQLGFRQDRARGVWSGPPESSDRSQRPQASAPCARTPAQSRSPPRVPWC